MLTFQRWTELTEANNRPVLTHLTHLEDLVYTKFEAGAKEAVSFLSTLAGQLSSGGKKAVNVSVKIDGSPSLVAGVDPTDGKFFVGTKGVFSKTPKLGKSHADIDALYQGRTGLLDIMHTAFEELHKLRFPNILQGDVLFTQNSKSIQTINGEKVVVFKPNTIVYTVPVDSELGQKVLAANFGISWHTTYANAASLATMSASAGAKPPNGSSSVLFVSPNYRDMTGATGPTLSPGDIKWVQSSIASLRQKTAQIKGNKFLQVMKQAPVLRDYLMQFQNQLVRQGSMTPKQFSDQFLAFISMVQAKEVGKRSSSAGKDTIKKRFDDFATRVQQFGPDIEELVEWQRMVIAIKLYIIEKLSKATTMGTHYNTPTGLIPGGHEGFVAVDKKGNMIKFVDRSEFSRRNFLQNN